MPLKIHNWKIMGPKEGGQKKSGKSNDDGGKTFRKL